MSEIQALPAPPTRCRRSGQPRPGWISGRRSCPSRPFPVFMSRHASRRRRATPHRTSGSARSTGPDRLGWRRNGTRPPLGLHCRQARALPLSLASRRWSRPVPWAAATRSTRRGSPPAPCIPSPGGPSVWTSRR